MVAEKLRDSHNEENDNEINLSDWDFNDLDLPDDIFAPIDYELFAPEKTPHEITPEEIANKAAIAAERDLKNYLQAKELINMNTPELLSGKLPPSQEKLLDGKKYVTGFSQSAYNESDDDDHEDTVHDAMQYIQQYQGLPLYGYTPSGRVLFNPSEADNAEELENNAILGYYGQHLIKVVVVAPLKEGYEKTKGWYDESEGRGRVKVESQFIGDQLPEDYVLKNTGYYTSQLGTKQKTDSINSKYIAGILAKNGEYFPNPEFMNDAHETKNEQNPE